MPLIDLLQLSLFVGVLFLITKPMGLYLMQVLDADGKTFLDRLIKPLERITYKLLGVDPKKEQDWKWYTISILIFSVVGILFTYLILRIQEWLPLNPQHLPNLSPDLAFNTAASFATNTNWQSYIPEATMSYFSQMVGLVIHNFTSAAMGITIAASVTRGVARHTAKTIGNFWTDLTRSTYYLLLPIALVFAVFLVSQGAIQNFNNYTTANLVQANGTVTTQTIPQGPLASQEAIKMLGTNGGGYMNANSAHPFENPNGLTNILEILAVLSVGSGLTYYFGRMVGNQKHGWAIWLAMLLLFLSAFFIAYHYEQVGNPIHQQLGVSAQGGNMEGKEVRNGIFGSSLFAVAMTDTSTGAVNSMHDSFTPLGGMVPMVNMQLDEIVFGGIGSGLYTMIVYIILTVFLAGLMIGRTPEYLGKKIEAYDVKMAALSVIILVIFILGLTAWAAVSSWGLAGLNNSGPHGLSEVLYAYTSGAENNGSAFAGLSANTPWYNTTLGLDMLFGRFFMIIPIMALAGSLAKKKRVAAGPGSFPVTGVTFVVLLIGVILLITALTFFPVLALGPIVEHFLMHAGTLF